LAIFDFISEIIIKKIVKLPKRKTFSHKW